jgi:oligosaccharide repeat unit polymerase
MKFKDVDVFSPYILIIAIIFYLLLAIVAPKFQITSTKPVFSTIIFYVFYGIFFFILGVLTSKFLNRYINITKPIFQNKKNSFKRILEDIFNEKIIILIILFAIFLQVVNIYLLGGLPILSGILKAKATTKLWLLSYLLFLPFINILIAKYNRKENYLLFLIGLVIFAATGYRTTTIAIILSVFITSYYVRKLKSTYFLIFVIFIVFMAILLGYIVIKSIAGQQWTLNPIELIFYRAAYTMNVLAKITALEGASKGLLFYYTLTGFFKSVDPRVIVGEIVLKYRHSTTSTIFGPALLDFGYIALAIQMFLIGLILKLIHSIQKSKKKIYTALYAIILAHTIIWVETGPTDLIVWIFYMMTIFAILYSIKWEKISLSPTRS